MTGTTVRLADLLRRAGVEPLAPAGADPVVLGVCLDSRKVRAGDLFCALRGARFDGEAYVGDAVARGARAVMASTARPAGLEPQVAWVRVADPRSAVGPLAREVWDRPDESMVLVGITGTNGKTTVAFMFESIARAAGRRTGRIGTTGYAYDEVEINAERTTPEATDLFALLAAMREAGTEMVAMEVSSHALALGRVRGARFSVAAFLNLGRDHLDFHGNRDAYFEAKASLFDDLGPDLTAVLPADDRLGGDLGRRTRARVLTFGRRDGADVRIAGERVSAAGSEVCLETPTGSMSVRIPLHGTFNVDNAAAAAACALGAGLPPESVSRGLETLKAVPGRMEPIDAGQPFAVIVDYAHTPDALTRVLQAARAMARGRVIVVFGCGGNRDRGKRAAMGAAAASIADRSLLTTDNPRGEDPEAILSEIRGGVAGVDGGAERATTVVDRGEAIRAALTGARDGDVVVIAGKGHETAQTFRDRVERFDDREVARAGLEELGWRGGIGAGA